MSLKSKMTALADAIRAKTGSADKLSIDGMIAAVGNFSGSGGGDTDAAYNEGYEQGKADEYKRLFNAMLDGSEPSGDIVIEAETIKASIFTNCKNITGVEMLNAKTIGNMAFYMCQKNTRVIFSATCETVGTSAFSYNSNLATVTFKGTPISIGSNCFTDCNKLLDIYVPWSEGTVADAPWGATKATVHYNSEVAT